VDNDVGEGKGEGEESNDLKEHMVGILFSRSKLTHLQKQVSCSALVDFISSVDSTGNCCL